jgi:hypothetical protein
MLEIRSFVSLPKSVSYYHTITRYRPGIRAQVLVAPHLKRYKRFCRFSPLLVRDTVAAPQMAKHDHLRHERVASFTRATICCATTAALQTLSVACPRYWSAIPLTSHRKQNLAAYGTVSTCVLLASHALLFVAPLLQRYKRPRSLIPATGAPHFDAPQIVKLGRLRHRFHKRVASFRRATIRGATNTLVESGAKRRLHEFNRRAQ